MKKTVYFPEIFAMVGEAKTREEKKAVLWKFRDEKGFINILQLCYDPKIRWVVTRREIENLEYDHMDIPDFDLAPTTLFLEARRRLYNYTNMKQPPLKGYKVLQLIAGMFSVMHHEEVELFKQMVAGRIEERGLTEKLVREVFPKLLSPAVDVKDPAPFSHPEKKVEPIKEPVVEPAPVHEPKEEPLTEGSMLSGVKETSNKEPMGYPPPPQKKKKSSKLDKHKKAIYNALEKKDSKASIARRFKISLSGFNNWLKKNPLEVD